MTSGYDGFKSSVDFPDPNLALDEGLIAVGGVLDVPTLFHAYQKGIFPWPQVGYPMLWFSPERRGILVFDEIHVSKKLEKFRRSTKMTFTTDSCFGRVIEECQKQPRKFQNGTWIVPELLAAYKRFHEAGFAHSLEVWLNGELVGGIYGVFVNGVFSGESMFHKQANASKLALLELVDHLRKMGLSWMDIQMVTPVTESLGGRYVTRMEFQKKIKDSKMIWEKNRSQF